MVPNGVDRTAFDIDEPKGADIVYLGRIEIAQKGIDLLVQAVARVRDRLPGARSSSSATARTARPWRRWCATPGSTRSCSWSAGSRGADRLRLLSSRPADRHAERGSRRSASSRSSPTAVGTPVLAFDIDCLRAVVPEGTGRLVPAFDVAALADALADMADDPAGMAEAGQRGRAFARRFDWDLVAAQQEALLVAAVEGRPVPGQVELTEALA